MKSKASILVDWSRLPKLPVGWHYTTVESVGAPNEQAVLTGPFGSNLGRSDFKDKGVPLLTIGCLTGGGISLQKAFFVSLEKSEELSRYQLSVGDLLFSRMASVGRVGIVGAAETGALFNYHLMRLRLDETKLLARFFAAYVQGAKQVRDYLLSVNHGATRDGINTDQLLGMPVAIAPIPEQLRIVAEIEKQFTRLDAGVAALRRVQANLKRYRAAILKAACEGRLVPTEADLARKEGRTFETGEQLLQRILSDRRKKWTGRGKYEEPAPPDTASLQRIPAGWTWATAEQLTDESRAITYGVIKLGERVADGVHVLRSSDVRHLRLDLQGVKRISPEIAGEYRRTFLKGGEILITVRGTLGGVVVAPSECAGFNISREVAMLAMVDPKIAKAVAIFIGSAPVQRWLMQRTKGIAYTGINIETLKQLPIPLPPLAEQKRIVAEVERRLSVIDELETVVTANLARATRLRQSVLRKAF